MAPTAPRRGRAVSWGRPPGRCADRGPRPGRGARHGGKRIHGSPRPWVVREALAAPRCASCRIEGRRAGAVGLPAPTAASREGGRGRSGRPRLLPARAVPARSPVVLRVRFTTPSTWGRGRTSVFPRQDGVGPTFDTGGLQACCERRAVCAPRRARLRQRHEPDHRGVPSLGALTTRRCPPHRRPKTPARARWPPFCARRLIRVNRTCAFRRMRLPSFADDPHDRHPGADGRPHRS